MKNQFGTNDLKVIIAISIYRYGSQKGESGGMVEIKRFLLYLPAELREAIRKEAEKRGLSSNSLIITILWNYFHN